MKQAKLALFGCNPLAMEVALRLAAAETPFVMIDRDPALLADALRAGFDAREMDYTDDDSLRRVGVGAEIDRVFCLLPEDSENVFLAISARAIDPSLRIIAVCQNPEAARKLRAAGADKVVDPYEISGARVHELIERAEVVDLLEQTVFGRQDLNVAEIAIPAQSWLCGRPLACLRGHLGEKLILLGVVDLEKGPDLIFSPRGVDHKLDQDDILVVIGARRSIESFRALVAATVAPDGPA